MIGNLLRYSVTFLFLLFLEVFIVAKFNIHFYVNPHVYILFIIVLPVVTGRHMILFMGFLMGFILDQFMGTGGLHAAATLIMASLRGTLLGAFAPREAYGREHFLTIERFGLVNFLLYCGFMILIHHFFLFLFELFTFRNFLFTLLRTLFSGLLSLVLITGLHMLISRKKST